MIAWSFRRFVALPRSGARVLALLSALVLGAAGCSVGSTSINDPAKVQTLRVGVTTMEEVRSMFGEPDESQVSASGEAVFTYQTVDRNAIGTTIAGIGTVAGTVYGTVGGARFGEGFASTGESAATAVGSVVGANIGKAADEKVHDSFRDQYRSLTVYFSGGVVRDYTISSARK